MEEDEIWKVDYLVCKLLSKTPTEVMNLESEDLNFLRAGVIWDITTSAKMGRTSMI